MDSNSLAQPLSYSKQDCNNPVNTTPNVTWIEKSSQKTPHISTDMLKVIISHASPVSQLRIAST